MGITLFATRNWRPFPPHHPQRASNSRTVDSDLRHQLRGATIHLDTTAHREPIGATAAWERKMVRLVLTVQ